MLVTCLFVCDMRVGLLTRGISFRNVQRGDPLTEFQSNFGPRAVGNMPSLAKKAKTGPGDHASSVASSSSVVALIPETQRSMQLK